MVARLIRASCLADQIDQLVGAEMSLLAEEHADDEVALARAPAAGWPQLFDELGGGRNGGHDWASALRR